MNSTTLKIVAVVSVLLAVVLAVVGFQLSRNYAEQAQKAQETEAARVASSPYVSRRLDARAQLRTKAAGRAHASYRLTTRSRLDHA